MTKAITLKHTLLPLAFTAVLLAAASHSRAAEQKLETAIFAGGCFWCVESDFEHVPGVVDAVSGYTGGKTENPTYKQVGAGGTGHLEAVRITYDANIVTYERLLHLFWRSIDPTDAGGQFCDRGESYTTAIFATSKAQKEQAEASRKALDEAKILPEPVVTPVREAGPFYEAEDYHQDYYSTHSYRYKLYRFGCGRDRRIESLWGEEAWAANGHS